MKFSNQELCDIALATLVLAFAFRSYGGMLVALLTVGVSFLTHELFGHKWMAQRMGAQAEFRAWPLGLLLAVLGSFVGFVFAAPGAVYFSPIVKGRFAFTVHRLSTKEVGMIGLAGPVINIVLGGLSLAALFYTGIDLFGAAAYINFFLAFFNLLPIAPLDGEKVFSWDWKIWLVAIAVSAAGYFLL